MEINSEVLKGKWKEIKGEIQKAWGKLTHDELEQTKGDLKAVQGLIEQKYGKAKDEQEKTLSEIVKKFESTRDQATEAVKEKLKQ
jgi:uncharacterized protein YjbJ (UPF0337 family)